VNSLRKTLFLFLEEDEEASDGSEGEYQDERANEDDRTREKEDQISEGQASEDQVGGDQASEDNRMIADYTSEVSEHMERCSADEGMFK